jgi:23S rRNA (pseudouridine1915-N3)-methyltransferase
MKLRIVALGHRMPAWVDAGYAEYAKRIDLSLVELKPESRTQGKTVAQLVAAEAVRVRAACAGTRIIVLDERGKPWTTKDFAASLARWSEEGCDVTFVIGSADGLDVALKREAAAMVSLSSCTLPHGLVRVMMAEQLYRATSLNAGHPYHRE